MNGHIYQGGCSSSPLALTDPSLVSTEISRNPLNLGQEFQRQLSPEYGVPWNHQYIYLERRCAPVGWGLASCSYAIHTCHTEMTIWLELPGMLRCALAQARLSSWMNGRQFFSSFLSFSHLRIHIFYLINHFCSVNKGNVGLNGSPKKVLITLFTSTFTRLKLIRYNNIEQITST